MNVRYWIVCAVFAVSACGSSSSPTAPSANVPFSQTDLVVGTGAEAVNGRRLTVNYTGWLYDANAVGNKGAQFDSSLSPGRTPFPFTLGTGGVIQGWDSGRSRNAGGWPAPAHHPAEPRIRVSRQPSHPRQCDADLRHRAAGCSVVTCRGR